VPRRTRSSASLPALFASFSRVSRENSSITESDLRTITLASVQTCHAGRAGALPFSRPFACFAGQSSIMESGLRTITLASVQMCHAGRALPYLPLGAATKYGAWFTGFWSFECGKMGRSIDTRHAVLLRSSHKGSNPKPYIAIGFSQQPRSDVTL